MKRIAQGMALVFFVLFVASTPALGVPAVESIEAVGITVSDMDRSLAFYTGTLSFRMVADREVAGDAYEHLTGVFGSHMRVVRLRLGDEFIDLIQYLAPRGRLMPIDSRSNDRWFQHIAIIVSDMDKAYAHLRQHQVEHASPGPQRLPDWNPNVDGIQAFYFRDPDGHFLEILQFPPGKGDPKWHNKSDRLFLGIDHTAIVVADTAATLRFYQDRLGLRVAGKSENYGIEQERLNNVFGARLRITSLKSPHGPAVELLEYLAPHSGRPMPEDTRPNDLWHWQIEVVVRDLNALAALLRAGYFESVSGSAVSLPAAELGFRHALMARDPDGHALLFMHP
jgi:catechol 2,3-dioxygenase-like lactoylglutathione lyase family enzyme